MGVALDCFLKVCDRADVNFINCCTSKALVTPGRVRSHLKRDECFYSVRQSVKLEKFPDFSGRGSGQALKHLRLASKTRALGTNLE
ncbi:hypothetical protein [Coleofasciculus sp. H7-2]|uniref:hypothetical protein n=1 Tax=Coleofasciculus sp. H7-2 TaxID=3351545 RepID=UPI00366F6860